MKAAAGALQATIFALLDGDATLGALVEGVFDFGGVEKSQVFPYVTIGEVSSDTWGTLTNDGEQVQATLHVWTQGRRMAPANAILNRLNELLGNATLTVTGYALARSLFETYNSVSDPDDRIQHLVVTYRVWMQEAP
jgi:hypothetical protein